MASIIYTVVNSFFSISNGVTIGVFGFLSFACQYLNKLCHLNVRFCALSIEDQPEKKGEEPEGQRNKDMTVDRTKAKRDIKQ